jgi:lipoprotein-anchoring transpeptidase ErfK/SrfK
MTGIARKHAAGPRRVDVRAGALASIVVAAVMLTIAATGAVVTAGPILASGASNPDPPAQPQPPHKHRHLPTPAPTPMALPPEVKAKVPAYKPGPIPFHDGEQLIYQASWVGIPAAQARLEFHKPPKDPSRWTGEIWIETNPFADVFYKMRDYMRESMADDTLHSSGVYLVQHEKSRLNYYDVSIDRPAQMVTMTKKNHKGTQSKEFIASDPWGPISGAMMALTQNFQPGKTYAFDVFSGSQRYVFAFVVEKREKIHLSIGDFDAWRIVPDVWYVSDGELRSQAHGTVLWISADERHLPLRIEAQAFIGSVRADLIKIDGKDGVESAQK